jgi:hypothetical protein
MNNSLVVTSEEFSGSSCAISGQSRVEYPILSCETAPLVQLEGTQDSKLRP